MNRLMFTGIMRYDTETMRSSMCLYHNLSTLNYADWVVDIICVHMFCISEGILCETL